MHPLLERGIDRDLRTYLFLAKKTVRQMAAEMEYSPNCLSQVMGGRARCGKRLARDIERATQGFVSAASLLARPAKKDKKECDVKPEDHGG